MSPIEKKLLLAAYHYYQQKGNLEFSYISPDDSDWRYALEAARQLYVSGFIDCGLDYVTSECISILPGNIPPITFSLTEKAFNELRTWRDSEM